ncbi:HvfC/BufC N-terminal domain-containing protein [Oryzibacter oryziterrae]|uniref:HvfC/BufC N-terminal domain-containing protein n=1 Tax=Oryzibacter oryziterrae TaxID=2766474 RepID=UPI001F23B22D|nr:DNA-binding domain-containing protein [Oryzibacter oryziterrae]
MNHAAALARFAAAVTDPALPPPQDIVTPEGPIDPLRFAVYRNNVHVGLVGALEARFAVTRRIVGDPFFRGMARAYVAEHKPASPLMFAYGDDFPAFVASLVEIAAVPYLADVAMLEVRWSHAYGAADVQPMTVADLARIPPDQLADCRAFFHPSAGWLHSDYPVATIWALHQEPDVPRFELGSGESVLVIRPDSDVLLHSLEPAEAAFVDHLIRGHTLGEAAEAAAAYPKFDFGTCLVGLVSIGALVALTPSIEDHA